MTVLRSEEICTEIDYCPYDRIEIWTDMKKLDLISKEKNPTKAYVLASLYSGGKPEDYDIKPEEVDEQREFVRDTLLTHLKKEILYLNFCLKWLQKVAKVDKWIMYEHDWNELLENRKTLIDIFYGIAPDEYLRFLTIATETMQFDFWDPLR